MKFWLPKSAAPKFVCRICNDRFYSADEMAVHAVRCSNEHEAELHEASLRTRSPFLFDTQNEGDIEWREHAKRTGDWH